MRPNKLLNSLEAGSKEYFNEARRIIDAKPELRHFYEEMYRSLQAHVAALSHIEDAVLELGSGGGFLDKYIPDLITSDVVGDYRRVDACNMPFADGSLKAIVMMNVFHHIPDVRKFLSEALRVLTKGGEIILIDCAHTPLSKVILKYFHPEPYDWKVKEWAFVSENNMTSANQALTYNVFFRDKLIFEKEFPELEFVSKKLIPSLRFIGSGGVANEAFLPHFVEIFLLHLDKCRFLSYFTSIFWELRLRKVL